VADEQEKLRARQAKAYATAASAAAAEANYYVRDPKTGLSPAQVEANKAVAEAASISGRTVTAGATGASATSDKVTLTGADRAAKTKKEREDRFAAELAAREASKPTEDPGPGNIWSYSVSEGRWKKVKVSNVTEPVVDTTGYKVVNGVLQFNGQPFTGTYNGQTYENGIVKSAADTTGYKVVNGVLLFNGQPFSGTYGGQTYENGKVKVVTDGNNNNASVFGSVEGTSTTRTLGRDQFKNSLALFFGAAEAAKPWVNALYDVVSKFYRTGSDVDQSFNLALQDARNNPALKPFTDRFKGIYALQDLKLTGKPVLVPTIAEYVVSQAKMADVLTQANLGSIATDEFTTELISKGNSVTTIADKIAKVYQRIDMAPKAIKDTLGRYFPTVDRTTLARTLLTGQKGVDQLVDELEQYEVLAAAEGQGLGAINRIGGVDLGRAQEYARSGQTFTSITPKFSQIARALPTTTKLSQISKLEDIGQVGLEKAVISQSAKELEQLEELGEQEIARYSGKAGRAELGLPSQRRANRAF
jgi:hypothetical protein